MLRFSDVFRWYRERQVALNGLNESISLLSTFTMKYFTESCTYVHQRLKNKKHQIILISEAKYPVNFSPRLLCKAKVQHIDNCQFAMCNKVKLVKKIGEETKASWYFGSVLVVCQKPLIKKKTLSFLIFNHFLQLNLSA